MGPPFSRGDLNGRADSLKALMADVVRWLEGCATRGTGGVLRHGAELGRGLRLGKQRLFFRQGEFVGPGDPSGVGDLGVGDLGNLGHRRAELPLHAVDPGLVEAAGDPLNLQGPVRDARPQLAEFVGHAGRAVAQKVVFIPSSG